LPVDGDVDPLYQHQKGWKKGDLNQTNNQFMKEPTIVANMSGSAKRVLFMGSWGGSMMRPCLVHLSQHVLKGIPL
jgi:hypothetical protein